jgi:hypothetical protein
MQDFTQKLVQQKAESEQILMQKIHEGVSALESKNQAL